MRVATTVVLHGGDGHFDPERKTGRCTHTLPNVYTHMLLQISVDYGSLPDVRSLTLHEIRFFYDGLRASLRKSTKQR